MIGGLVSKKKEKVDIRHREGTKNGGAHVGAQFGGSPESQNGKGSEKSPGGKLGRWASPWRNTEGGVAKTRGCIGISSRRA